MDVKMKQFQALVDQKVAQRVGEKIEQFQALVDTFGADLL